MNGCVHYFSSVDPIGSKMFKIYLRSHLPLFMLYNTLLSSWREILVRWLPQLRRGVLISFQKDSIWLGEDLQTEVYNSFLVPVACIEMGGLFVSFLLEITMN